MVQFLSINFFSWISSIFVGFFKSSRFFCVTLYYVSHSLYSPWKMLDTVSLWSQARIAHNKLFTRRRIYFGETGWLLSLCPQNKRLHTPATHHKHIRQDRRIQTELASTLAKNATKPTPLEIIPLQTTGKENNWKTEDTLARAAVTLEMERIKGPNPWCLWWRWNKILIEVIYFLTVLSMRIINVRFVLFTHVCVSHDIISTRFSTVSFIGRNCIFSSNDALIPSTGPLTIVALCIFKTCSANISTRRAWGLEVWKISSGTQLLSQRKRCASVTSNAVLVNNRLYLWNTSTAGCWGF